MIIYIHDLIDIDLANYLPSTVLTKTNNDISLPCIGCICTIISESISLRTLALCMISVQTRLMYDNVKAIVFWSDRDQTHD